MDDLIGKTIGQYQVVALAGKGGMATVYKAYQPSLNRYVALKVLPEYLAHDQEFVLRFQQEAAAAAALRHPNILVIHEIGEAGDLHYIAMEYLEGQTLEQVLARGGALPLPRVVKIVNQLALALEAAHQRGLIHRDVKPSNVFIGPDDHVTLMDFGIVKAMSATRLTRTGLLVGTPEYMSPEQAEGQPLDRRSDLYSLGVVTYQMLTGCVPFTAPTPNAVLYAHVNKPPTPPSRLNPAVPQPLEAVVLRALAKRPDDRFQSVAEFAAALDKAARQAEGQLAAALFRDARQLLAQGKPDQAQAKLEQLRQISPDYPGLAGLAAEVACQVQVEREYAEVVKLVQQARDKAAEFKRRVPRHPDPAHIFKALVVPARASGGDVWLAVWAAGLSLAVGGLLGFWYVSADSWGSGLSLFFEGGLKEYAALVPWMALGFVVVIVGIRAITALARHEITSRVLGAVGATLAALGFVTILALLLSCNFTAQGTGPTLVLVGLVLLGMESARCVWRKT